MLRNKGNRNFWTVLSIELKLFSLFFLVLMKAFYRGISQAGSISSSKLLYYETTAKIA